jgi:hypothetical protein
MGMPGIGDARREVIMARTAPHLWHIKIGFFQTTTELAKDGFDVLLGFWMVDEIGLQFTKNLSVSFDRHVMLSRFRIERGKCVLYHSPCKFAEDQGAFPG